ncbi:MAG: hypothetical protein ACYCTI_07715, partial [Acidimicrobiales bacterium]
MTPARPPRRRRRLTTRSGFVLAAGVVGATALGVAPPAFASGTSGGTTGGTTTCPAPNPPDTLTATAGTPQTTKVASSFQTDLSVAFSNSNGCPLTSPGGISVTFSAPSSGASGIFSTTGSTTVTVGSDPSGTATAPTFTANGTGGNYTVVANSAYGSAYFSLTNTVTGVPSAISAVSGTPQSTQTGTTFSAPFQVEVTDANANPVSGASVSFSAPGGGGASGSFATGGASTNELTNSSGMATAPPFTANAVAGSYTLYASTPGLPSPAAFSLTNLASSPAAIAVVAGTTPQAATVASRFPTALAVTVTDANHNPVAGAMVTFSAPSLSPSASFVTGGSSA